MLRAIFREGEREREEFSRRGVISETRGQGQGSEDNRFEGWNDREKGTDVWTNLGGNLRACNSRRVYIYENSRLIIRPVS